MDDSEEFPRKPCSFMQRAKREDAKENIPSVASPNERVQAAPGVWSADTRAHECPCMHQAVPEFILLCLKQEIILSTVLVWDLQQALVILPDTASSVSSP